MLKVISEISGRMAECTIATGIVLPCNTRIGAMADIDLFACFTIDIPDAIKAINKREGTNIPVPAWSEDCNLWRVEKRGKNARFDLDKSMTVVDNEKEARIARVEALALRYATGELLFDDSFLDESEDDDGE